MHVNSSIRLFDRHVGNADKLNVPSKLPVVYMLDYQEDKSLAGARIICENQEQVLKYVLKFLFTRSLSFRSG